MTIKTTFKRSLLNQQPVGNIAISRPFSLEPIGFSEIIEKQDDLPEQDSIDSGDDSVSSLKTSAGQAGLSVNKAEFLVLENVAVDNLEDEIKTLRIKKLEAQIERDDYSFVVNTIQNNPELQAQLEDQKEKINKAIEKSSKVSTGLRRISRAISKIRENYNFISSKQKLQQAAKSIFEEMPQKYNTANQGFIPVDSQFPGIENINLISTTSRIAGLIYSLLLPANARFKNNGTFSIPSPAEDDDPVSSFLSILSSNNIIEESGFRSVDAMLPTDPIERINLLSEALSYELSFTKGLKELGFDSLTDYVNQKVGKFTTVFESQPLSTTYLSILKQNNVLPFETADVFLDSANYKGILSGLIDESFMNEDFELNDIEEFSNSFVDYMQNITDDLKVLHCLDDVNEDLSSTTFIKKVMKIVHDLIETIYEGEVVGSILKPDGSQFHDVRAKIALILLSKLGSSYSTVKGPGIARFNVFESIFLSDFHNLDGINKPSRIAQREGQLVTNVTSTITKQDNSRETTRIETRTALPEQEAEEEEEIERFEVVSSRTFVQPVFQNTVGAIPKTEFLSTKTNDINDIVTSKSTNRIIGLSENLRISFRQGRKRKVSFVSSQSFRVVTLKHKSRVASRMSLELHHGTVFIRNVYPFASLFEVGPLRGGHYDSFPNNLIRQSPSSFAQNLIELCRESCLKTLDSNSTLVQFEQTKCYSLDFFDVSFMIFELLCAVSSLCIEDVKVKIDPDEEVAERGGSSSRTGQGSGRGGSSSRATNNSALPEEPKVICRIPTENGTFTSPNLTAAECIAAGGTIVE